MLPAGAGRQVCSAWGAAWARAIDHACSRPRHASSIGDDCRQEHHSCAQAQACRRSGAEPSRGAPCLPSPEPTSQRLDQRLYLILSHGHSAGEADMVQLLGVCRNLRRPRRRQRHGGRGRTLAAAAWRGVHHGLQGRQAGRHRGQQLAQRAQAAGRHRHCGSMAREGGEAHGGDAAGTQTAGLNPGHRKRRLNRGPREHVPCKWRQAVGNSARSATLARTLYVHVRWKAAMDVREGARAALVQEHPLKLPLLRRRRGRVGAVQQGGRGGQQRTGGGCWTGCGIASRYAGGSPIRPAGGWGGWRRRQRQKGGSPAAE